MSDNSRDTSKEHGERIAAREAANTPWKAKVVNGLTMRPTKDEQQTLDIRQNISLRKIYDILRAHIDNPFSDPAKCAAFNESYEILRRYYEEQYK